jgi:hypothetical protein
MTSMVRDAESARAGVGPRYGRAESGALEASGKPSGGDQD